MQRNTNLNNRRNNYNGKYGNQSPNRYYNNGQKNDAKHNSSNGSAKKSEELNKKDEKSTKNLTQNLPGIPVNPSLSGSAFVTLQANQSNKEIKTNGCGDGSGDKKDLEKITQQLSAIGFDATKDNDLKADEVNVSKDKPIEANINVSDKSSEQNKVWSNSEKRPNTYRGSDSRRNTISHLDRRFQKSDRQVSKPMNNEIQHRFSNTRTNRSYGNNRYNNDSNEANNRYPKSKTITPAVSSMSSSGSEFNSNVGSLVSQNIYYPVDPYYNTISYPNCPSIPFANQQYMTQPFESFPRPVGTNAEEVSSQTAINSGQNNQEGEQPSNSIGNVFGYDSTPFAPYLPFDQLTTPVYYGYIQCISDTSGSPVYYFVSLFPQNMIPLKLETDPNGIPLLPINFKLMISIQ